ncbi:MAG: DUF4236 domain-containing protein [Prevotellaceae bacterium]|nr:DUF4236 domain-containing protein [Prevotellaceae bacterium]
MGINYRRRIRLFPGVTLNISKRGISTTVGKKGMSVNVGSKGAYLNTGLPGTGVYSRKKLSGAGSGSQQSTGGCLSGVGCWSSGALFIGILVILYALILMGSGVDGPLPLILTIGILLTLPFFVSLVSHGSGSSGEADIPDPLFQQIVLAVDELFEFLRSLARKRKLLGSIGINVASTGESITGRDRGYSIDIRIAVLAHTDLLRVYKGLGYDVHSNTAESVALALFSIRMLSVSKGLGEVTEQMLRGKFWEAAQGVIESTECYKYEGADDVLILADTLEKADVDKSLAPRYLTLLRNLSSLLAQVSGEATPEETAYLDSLQRQIDALSGEGEPQPPTEG